MIAPTVGQFLHSAQSPQVATFLLRAHLRISHRCSQNTVFAPLARQPSQLMCSGRMGALFNSAHSFAVISRVSHGENPMKADRKHVHYRLLDMGLSKQQTVAVLYLVSACLGLTAVLLSTTDCGRLIPLLLAVVVVGAVAYRLYRHRRSLLKGGQRRPDLDVRPRKENAADPAPTDQKDELG